MDDGSYCEDKVQDIMAEACAAQLEEMAGGEVEAAGGGGSITAAWRQAAQNSKRSAMMTSETSETSSHLMLNQRKKRTLMMTSQSHTALVVTRKCQLVQHGDLVVAPLAPNRGAAKGGRSRVTPLNCKGHFHKYEMRFPVQPAKIIKLL